MLMPNERFPVTLKMQTCAGYGATPQTADRVSRAFCEDLSDAGIAAATGPCHLPSSGTIAALEVPFDPSKGGLCLDKIMAVSIKPDRVSHVAVRALTSKLRDLLGGILLTYTGQHNMQIGPRRPATPMPTYYLMSHGLVVLHGQILEPGEEEGFVADVLTEHSLLLLGRSGSNHDRLIFTAQAIALVSRLAAASGYIHLDIRTDLRDGN
jgi:hypothetical protein